MIDSILSENLKRLARRTAVFDPLTGQGSVGERFVFELSDFALPRQWLPVSMARTPLVASLAEAGSIAAFVRKEFGREHRPDDNEKVADALVRLRFRHDFPFWAAALVKIKNKQGGDDIAFRLTRPQRILVERFERCRLQGRPIRLVLLKAHQWGGSTTTQLYMAWLQLVHCRGLNSLIIAHQGAASDEIKDMFDRMLRSYPAQYLHEMGEAWSESEPKLVGVGRSGSTHRVPQRNCKIKIGTAERPDGCRGGDYSLVHLSEVGIWKRTDGKSPEDIVRSACSGILLRPLTMIVMESTANGTGNFFHTEYAAAASAETPSQFEPLFIAWHDIEQYSRPFATEDERRGFARRLWEGRDSADAGSAREESGRYLWRLWEMGATLEGINWYVGERAGKNDHAVMASEFPSDDEEAFVHSGAMVFDKYLVKGLAAGCRPPVYVGELQAAADDGEDSLAGLRFREDSQGRLCVWAKPFESLEGGVSADEPIENRYLVVVDVGGRSDKSDWSVVAVFDRANMIDGGVPEVVAQWRGHCDIDRLAWRAAQIAWWYDQALLVIESNTLETRDKERHIEGGDQSLYILNQISTVYPNLYARRQSEDEIRQGVPRKYGFHTNLATKPMVISTLIRAVRDCLWVERDRRCLDEIAVYERKSSGAYGAIAGHHDDMLMTRAIGLHICFHEMAEPHWAIPRTGRPRPRYLSGEAAF